MEGPILQGADPHGKGFHGDDSVGRSVKGCLGQALVQKYFQYAGWAVAPTGVESVVDHVMHLGQVDLGDVARLPDFMVSKAAGSATNPTTHPLGQAFYVEVKTHAQWRPMDCSRYTKFGHVLLVWVGPNGLRGVWLSRPAGEANATVARSAASVDEADFQRLASVGGVWLRHCADTACEQRVREQFDRLAIQVAAWPVREPPALSPSRAARPG